MAKYKSNKGTILIVEDEPSQLEILAYNLRAEKYDVFCSETGEEALLLVQENEIDLILLDWMLPNTSGLEVCRQIKRKKMANTPYVIMLTARGDEDDKIRGLDMGADDYLVKPYSLKELLARVRAGLRKNSQSADSDRLIFGDLEMDLEKRSVFYAAKKLDLGPLEFKLLHVFLKSPMRVFSRDQLLEKIWNNSLEIQSRTVDVHIGRLRKQLNKTNDLDMIKTVRGFGYCLSDR